MNKKKYIGLDWLRALSCFGIVVWHIKANSDYAISGFIYDRFIPSFNDFVYLFMAVSAFGMCCGYYDKVMNGKVNWADFYKKRYLKIFPFFALLVVLDLAMGFSKSSLFEAVTELTLLHGFIPNDLSVIGVAWFLGTVFIFYLIFPFFCSLIENKKKAWKVLVVAMILSFIATYHFGVHRKNFLVSFCFFVTGGLVFKYKEQIEKIKWYWMIPVSILVCSSYFIFGGNAIVCSLVSAILLIQGITIPKSIKPISFFSNISMEVFLSHMVFFRAVEKLHLNSVIGNGWCQYLFTCVLVILGAIVFSFVTQKLIFCIEKKIGMVE